MVSHGDINDQRDLSGANGRQRRGGQADRCPIGGFLPTSISAYFRRTCSICRYLQAPRGIPYLCYIKINQCLSDI